MARKNLKTVQPIKLVVEHDKPMASSLQVAKHFRKDHNHVLRDIRSLIKDLPEEWVSSNFGPIEESVLLPHSGGIRKDPAYLLTRDAFTLLAMGFTGKMALAWKLKYIKAFNAMEAKLLAGAGISQNLPSHLVLSPTSKSEPAVYRQRLLAIVRAKIVEWAQLDSIPLRAAETALCAYLQSDDLEDLPAETLSQAIDFLQKATGRLSRKGAPATKEQLEKIRALMEACCQYRGSRNLDVRAFMKHQYDLEMPDFEKITAPDADKILHMLPLVFHEMKRVTLLMLELNDILQNKAGKKCVQ